MAPILVEELFGLIRGMRARGVTVLMIEQNAKRALEQSDVGIVLELGSTRMQERADRILADPRIGQLFLGGGLEPTQANVLVTPIHPMNPSPLPGSATAFRSFAGAIDISILQAERKN